MPRRSPTRTATAALLAAGLVLLAACHDGKGDQASSTTATTVGRSTTSAPAGSSSSTSASAPPVSSACPATPGGDVPSGMASRVMGDVDGDGRPDTLYVGVGADGLRRFGVVTATGARSEWTIPNASPVDPSIYGVADADQDGRAEVFVNPGRVVYLLTYASCTLQPYLNKDGQPYAFSIGFGAIGTGVGCIDADGDGRRDLVGLDQTDAGTGKVAWTRTIVTLHGTQARNGAKSSGTYTSPADDHAIALLNQVTCGDDAFTHPLSANP
jgi:hypothetical protein